MASIIDPADLPPVDPGVWLDPANADPVEQPTPDPDYRESFPWDETLMPQGGL